MPRQITVRGHRVAIEAIACTVLETQRWSETHVRSSGGGGYIQGGSGMISAPRVDSTTVDRNEVWLRRKDTGREFSVEPHFVLKCRPGHELSLVLVRRRSAGYGQWLAAANHATGSWQEIAHYDSVLRFLRLRASRFLLFAGWALVLTCAILWFASGGKMTLEAMLNIFQSKEIVKFTAEAWFVTLLPAFVIAILGGPLADHMAYKKLLAGARDEAVAALGGK